MDTIYSNKKYLQNLTAGSDYYRTSNSGRPIVVIYIKFIYIVMMILF